ncbi:hypothetical protein [Mariprofundus sp. NF]|uniref:hypothetical protein n=1 Tax=Mariprofundus sp. NF TaxID=2608716 RepID=UPI0015A03662|nr:hypothetical protein [Mariprofundus sp. NF]
METSRESGKPAVKARNIMVIALLGICMVGLVAGVAYAAKQSIQLDSAATFPVDI